MLVFALFHGAAVALDAHLTLIEVLSKERAFFCWYTIWLVRLPVGAFDSDN